MSNNRHLINDSEIIRPPLALEKGLPLPFFGKMYEVMEGWVAVMVAGGAYQETLAAGTYNLAKYPAQRGLQVIQVNTRVNTLLVSTTREFTIAQPVPVEINLDVSVEYRVVDARRVALEINRPLTSLYDRVLQAMRGAVVDATVDEIRRQGEGIAQTTLRRLNAMRLPDTIGIEVTQVLVTSIKATDAGNDTLARMEMERLQTLEQWKTDAYMTQNSRVTWEWILLHRPEVAQQLILQHGTIIKELVDKGLFDPAGFLNQPTSMPQNNNPFGMLGSLGGFPPLTMGTPNPAQAQPQLGAGATNNNDVQSRMREEIGYLKSMPGAKVEVLLAEDGAYLVRVQLPRTSGGELELEMECPVGYPRIAPIVALELDGEPTPIQSTLLRRWAGQYLVEIAREAKSSFG